MFEERSDSDKRYTRLVNSKFRALDKAVDLLEDRIALIENRIQNPNPDLVQKLIREFGVVTLTPEQSKILARDLRESMVEAEIAERKTRRHRLTDSRIWQITTIASPIIAAVAVIVAIYK